MSSEELQNNMEKAESNELEISTTHWLDNSKEIKDTFDILNAEYDKFEKYMDKNIEENPSRDIDLHLDDYCTLNRKENCMVRGTYYGDEFLMRYKQSLQHAHPVCKEDFCPL